MYVVEDPNATAQSEETKLPASAKSKITLLCGATTVKKIALLNLS